MAGREQPGPRRDEPWHAAPPGTVRRVLRGTVLAAGLPLLTAGWLLDRLLTPVAHRAGLSNAYRLLVRRDDG